MTRKKSLYGLRSIGMLFAVLLLHVSALAQDEFYFAGTLRNEETSAKLDGVLVQVFKNGAQYDALTTSKNGKYDFSLELGFIYQCKYSKNGFAHKILEFDLKNLNSEDFAGGFQLAPLDVALFTVSEEFDMSIMDVPMGIATYDAQQDAINFFDSDYINKRKLIIDNEKERVEELIRNRAQMQKEFDQLMKRGDDKMFEDKFKDAIDKYEEALKIFPNDETAQAKLADAQKKYDESQKDKAKESEYQGHMADGHKAFKNEEWSKAKSSFESALKIKPGDKEATGKINEINDILENIVKRGEFNDLIDQADKKFGDEDYKGAKKLYEDALKILPNEIHPRDQIKECERRMKDAADALAEQERIDKEYNELMKFGDKNFKDKEYKIARDKYEDALALKPNEPEPQRLIDDIDRILADMADEEERLAQENAENAERDRIEAEYQAFVKKGNELFKDRDLDAAQREYEGALGVKPGDKFAENKLKAIEDLREEMAADQAKEDEANNRRAEQEAIDREYERLVKLGDDFFADRNLEQAKGKYQEALEVKDEKYPKSKIKRIDELLAEAEEASNADELAEIERKKREEEEARLAEEQRLADELAEKQRLLDEKRRQAEEEERNTEASADQNRNYETVSSEADDKAVKFFRDAKRIEDLAKIEEVNSAKEKNQKLHTDLNSSANDRRRDLANEVDRQQESMVTLALNGEDHHDRSIRDLQNEEEKNRQNQEGYKKKSDRSRERNESDVQEKAHAKESLNQNDRYRQRKVDQHERKTQVYSDQTEEFVSKGDANRVDEMFEVERVKERTEGMMYQGEENRQDRVVDVQLNQEKISNYQKDLKANADVKRDANVGHVDKMKESSEGIASGKEIYMVENNSEVEKQKSRQQTFNANNQIDAEMRRIERMESIGSKYKGEEKDKEDYVLGDGQSDIPFGVSETSREQGNKVIIERTVRDGNKIDVYKKVVSKTGIYYFKNGKSTTVQVWELETVKDFD